MDISKEIVASLTNAVDIDTIGITTHNGPHRTLCDDVTGKLIFNKNVLNKETKNMALAYIAACEQHGI